MFDLKLQEPKIEIFHPLLILYNANAAILYGYLHYYAKNNNLKLTDDGECYTFSLSKYEIKDDTGLSIGNIYDAAMDLLSANLAVFSDYKMDYIAFDLYLYNEDHLRRKVNKKINNWKI